MENWKGYLKFTITLVLALIALSFVWKKDSKPTYTDLLDYTKSHKSQIFKDIVIHTKLVLPYSKEDINKLKTAVGVCSYTVFNEHDMDDFYINIFKQEYITLAISGLNSESISMQLINNSGGINVIYEDLAAPAKTLIDARHNPISGKAIHIFYTQFNNSPSFIQSGKDFNEYSSKLKKNKNTRKFADMIACIKLEIAYTLLGGNVTSSSRQYLEGIADTVKHIVLNRNMDATREAIEQLRNM